MHRDGPWLIHAGEGYRLDLLVGDDPLDGNIDIEVTLDSDSSRWSGTVFTVENLAALLDRHESSTGKSTAQYVWADGMVVVPSLDPDAIVAVVEELLRSGEYRDALTFLEDDGSVDDAILRHQAGQGDELAQWALGTSEKMEGTT